ncbi:unnamed protein product, partial [Meganyctiphanes norvegica]
IMGETMGSVDAAMNEYSMFWAVIPYLSICLSIFSLAHGFVSYAFEAEASPYQYLFLVFSYFSCGIRLVVCAAVGAAYPGYLWGTIVGAYLTSTTICIFYHFFPLIKYKIHHRFIPFTCLNTTLFNTINTAGLCLNIVYICCFATLHSVQQVNLFPIAMTSVWCGCGVLLGISLAFVIPLIFAKINVINIFPEEVHMGRLWNNNSVF